MAHGDSLWNFSEAVARACERLLAFALIGAIVLNFANVVGRYVTGFTLTGADEIEVYILIWIAFAGAAIVSWRQQHLRMDVLLKALPQWLQSVIATLETCILAAVTSFVAFQSYRYVEKIYALGAVSDIARIPTWIPHSAVFAGFGVIALIAVVRLFRRLLHLPSTVSNRVDHGQRP